MSATTSAGAPSTGRRASWRSPAAARCWSATSLRPCSDPEPRRVRSTSPTSVCTSCGAWRNRSGSGSSSIPGSSCACPSRTRRAGHRPRLGSRPIARRSSGATTIDDSSPTGCARERIVTLSGVGGVGKTRLAIDVAVNLAGFDVVEFVPLAGLSAADDVAAAIAGVLGATIALDPGDAVVAALGTSRRSS